MNDYDRGSRDMPIKASTAEWLDAQRAQAQATKGVDMLIPLPIAFLDFGAKAAVAGSGGESQTKPYPQENDSSGRRTQLPTDPYERKGIPIVSGVLDYFPAALAEIAKVSKAGNDQHNLGEPLHWSRGKSTDQADTILRHLVERGTIDSDGQRHSAKMAWRALALLQLELEAEGAPIARGAKL